MIKRFTHPGELMAAFEQETGKKGIAGNTESVIDWLGIQLTYSFNEQDESWLAKLRWVNGDVHFEVNDRACFYHAKKNIVLGNGIAHAMLNLEKKCPNIPINNDSIDAVKVFWDSRYSRALHFTKRLLMPVGEVMDEIMSSGVLDKAENREQQDKMAIDVIARRFIVTQRFAEEAWHGIVKECDKSRQEEPEPKGLR